MMRTATTVMIILTEILAAVYVQTPKKATFMMRTATTVMIILTEILAAVYVQTPKKAMFMMRTATMVMIMIMITGQRLQKCDLESPRLFIVDADHFIP
jgi:hypothetical protein